VSRRPSDTPSRGPLRGERPWPPVTTQDACPFGQYRCSAKDPERRSRPKHLRATLNNWSTPLDGLVGASKRGRQHGKARCLRGFEIITFRIWSAAPRAVRWASPRPKLINKVCAASKIHCAVGRLTETRPLRKIQAPRELPRRQWSRIERRDQEKRPNHPANAPFETSHRCLTTKLT
jgi:hypothetical protein